MGKYTRQHYRDVAREIAMEYRQTKGFDWINRNRKVTPKDIYVRTMKIDTLRNLVSKFEIKKNINGYNISFNLADDLMKLGESTDTSININKVF